MMRRDRGGWAWRGALATLALAAAPTACQRAAPPAAGAASSVAQTSKISDTTEGRSSFDSAIAVLEERTGERLTLVVPEHDYSAVYPAWLPDSRLVVPGDRGVTIVEPRSGATTSLPARGRRALVSSDGKTLAIASSLGVELLDAATGQSLTFLEASLDDDDDRAIQFSPDGRLFAFTLRGGSETGKLLGLFDIARRALRGTLDIGRAKRPQGLTARLSAEPLEGDDVTSFELRDERVVATLASGRTALWDTAGLDLLLLLGGPSPADAKRHRAQLSADGAYATAWTPVEGLAHGGRGKPGASAAAGVNGGGLHAERRRIPVLIDARAGEVVRKLEDKACVPFGIAMHPKDSLVAVGSLYPGFCVWDLAERKIKQRVRIAAAPPPADKSGASLVLRLAAKMSPKMDLPMEHLAFDATGEQLTVSVAHLGALVVRLADGAVRSGALSKDSRQEEARLAARSATSPDQSMVAAAGTELRVWDVASGRVLRRMAQHEQHALLAWTPGAFTIVGVEGTVVRFRTETGELAERRPRPIGFDDVTTVSNRAGTLVMVSSRPTGLRALRVDETSKVVPLARPSTTDGILAAAASDDGRRIAVSTGSELAVFDAATGTAVRVIAPRGANPGESNAATRVALDDEGQLVAAVVQNAPHLWNVSTGQEISLGPGDCNDVKFRPKTQHLAGACRNQVRLWDGRTGASLAVLDGGDLPEELFFDGSGTRLAELGAKFLTVLDGQRLVALNQMESELPTSTSVFSPSSRLIAIGVRNGEGVEFYRAADGKRLGRLQMWPNDEAWIVRNDRGQYEILGDVERVQSALECRVGKYVVPMDACRERFAVAGLFAQILSERSEGAP